MTIAQIYEEAKRQLDKGVITIGEFSEIVDREYQEPSKWILCSERLPERVEWYLTSIKWADGIERVIISWFDGMSFKAEVIAWMFLPEPYKVESEGEE